MTFTCPIPTVDGKPLECGCTPDERCAPEVAYRLGAGLFEGAPAPAVESAPDPAPNDQAAPADPEGDERP